MKPIHKRMTGVLIAGCFVAVAAFGWVSTSSANEKSTGLPTGIDERTPALKQSSKSVSPSSISLLSDMSRSMGIGLDRSRARAVHVGADHRLSVVPTVHGGICESVEYQGVQLGASCTDQFPADGVLVYYVHGVGPDKAYGIIEEGVTAVNVVDGTGATVKLDISSGAFWFEAARGESVKMITSERRGVRSTNTVSFRVPG